ncbi:unnamed protein product [Lampetra planeri]
MPRPAHRPNAEVGKGTAWHDGTTYNAGGKHHLVQGAASPCVITVACQDTSLPVAKCHDNTSPDHHRRPPGHPPLNSTLRCRVADDPQVAICTDSTGIGKREPVGPADCSP